MPATIKMAAIFTLLLWGIGNLTAQTTTTTKPGSRRLLHMEPTPFKASYEEGVCWVWIKVDPQGNVIQAKTVKAIPSKKPIPDHNKTTITNKAQWKVAQQVAKTYQYNPVDTPKAMTGHIAIRFIKR